MSNQREVLADIVWAYLLERKRIDTYHLADAILRDWLPDALADERVVEAAAVALASTYDQPGDDFRDEASLMLTAAVTAMSEEGS